MNNLFFVAVGFILGVVTCLYLGIIEVTGKLNKNKIKEMWELLFAEDIK